MGRIPIAQKLDDDQVEKLARKGMTMEEIEDLFGLGGGHVGQSYREAYNRGTSQVKMSLRQAQLEKALVHKDTKMLIHLGKHILGQTDRQKLEHSGNAEIVVQWFGDNQPKVYDSSDS